jgi:hypothetical protein
MMTQIAPHFCVAIDDMMLYRALFDIIILLVCLLSLRLPLANAAIWSSLPYPAALIN